MALAVFAGVPAAGAVDLSAETVAIVHDLMAPYRTGQVPATPGVDPKAVEQALAILDRENLLDFARPTTRPLGIADKLGRALAMGTRTPQFLREMAAVRDAIVRQDDQAAGKAIQDLYAKMGRTPPKGAALDGLVQAVKEIVGAEPQETERVIIERPDYTVTVENARAAGQARVAVLYQKGPDGRPARVEFKGEVESRPDVSGKDLEMVVEPAPAPATMTSAQADELRKRLNGRWRDQDGVEYEISGEGATIVVTELRAAGKPRPYTGRFNLGLISAAFPIDEADDMGPGLPPKVREQLAGMGLSFRISLSAAEDGAKLDGTWSSQHVTYGSDEVVKRVHSPYDVPLVLTRGETKTAQGGRWPDEGP